MEVIEIVSHFINKDSNVLRVEFRCAGDDNDTVRTDIIEYELLSNYGYDTMFVFNESFESYDDDEYDDDWNFDGDDFMDEDDLLSFLNEYYIIEGKLPDAEYL